MDEILGASCYYLVSYCHFWLRHLEALGMNSKAQKFSANDALLLLLVEVDATDFKS